MPAGNSWATAGCSSRCTRWRTSRPPSRRPSRRSAPSPGKPPRGWESPGLTETPETIDHLAAAGIDYVANWVLDDQPVYVRTAGKSVVSVPYTLELNDIAMMVIQNHPAEELLRRGRDQFDRLYAESAHSMRVMAIAVHPYITGVPHRIRYLEELYRHILGKPGVVHWTGGEIAQWFRSAVPAP